MQIPARLAFSVLFAAVCAAQSPTVPMLAASWVAVDRPAEATDFPLVAKGKPAAIYVAPGNPETVRVAAAAFARDVEQVTGVRPRMLTSLRAPLPANLIVAGVLGNSPEIDRLRAAHALATTAVDGKWEAAETVTIVNPPARILPGVRMVLVVAGSDRRGTAYALFALSRAMGVSPWIWWADVPVAKHTAVYVQPGMHVQDPPSVQYRGIFFNDEDWGLRPWAAKKMDPEVDKGKGNIGPRTYERVFELLLRLHANSLWPAMHPGSLAFNAVPENAKLADKWGIVMGSSHSEALLRNNVGEWSEAAPPKGDGPWNYQTNSAAMNTYWDKRLAENGRFENFYTVGLRGLHDSGLEAEGTPQVKAKLVEDVMTAQRKLLAARVAGPKDGDIAKVPQVIWLYKESLDLYREGMKVADDVTLGWTDDNYGYIRELPNAAEQKRSGGSGVYYHVSYWGAPHDYLWLCTTPPALLQEELTKAYDHGARKYWILNVGDLKPAEIDIDYFMQLATDEPRMAKISQQEFLSQWADEQFPAGHSGVIADLMTRYYALNFIRRPEFMGFNGYNDGVQRTSFNPLAWGTGVEPDQNRGRAAAWSELREDESEIAKSLPQQTRPAFFELVGYPIEGAAAMNEKFLATDLSYLDAAQLNFDAMKADATRARAAYDTIQKLTAKYNSIAGGKWDGMMSAAPRERHVFEMPLTATEADAKTPLPPSWGADDSPAIAHPAAQPSGFHEQRATVSINASHFSRKHDLASAAASSGWHVLPDLGISGDSIEYGSPGLLANADNAAATSGPQDTAWMEYDFATTTSGPATLALHMLPTFAVDSEHRLRYAVALDGGVPVALDLTPSAVPRKAAGDGPSDSGWAENVLRNSAVTTLPLGALTPGKHTLRLIYRDPGVVFEHIVITFPDAPPAYPVPPETK